MTKSYTMALQRILLKTGLLIILVLKTLQSSDMFK